MINIQYIIIGLIILVACFFIFKRDTYINKRLENFNGDDLNIHINNDLNIIPENNESNENNIIE